MPNRLASETSPYLLQHADNPVDWYPWGEEALTLARSGNRPILLSIGYSACHWCHVMAHESFEDPAIAALMNELFVNVKVDREERPDLDQIYQSAHALLSRRGGGWPLTVFLTPDQVPFFAGTYFPQTPRHGLPGFGELLVRIAQAYREQGAAIGEQNGRLREALASINPERVDGVTLDAAPLAAAMDALESSFDPVDGGFGHAPKFPHPTDLALCLRMHLAARDSRGLRMASVTLERMAEGGIFDHVAGGFCRYSVDARWTIPHFEKMLYDNAQLLPLYADAWRLTGEDRFEQAARATAAWATGVMQHAEGGFRSSLDADSEGEEGKFYLWTPDEVRSALTDSEYAVVAPHWGLDQPPNFEGHAWNLRVATPLAVVASRLSVTAAQARATLESARAKLAARRALRVPPGRDDKVLTSWNALVIGGLAHAARVMGEPQWLVSARRGLDFLHARMWNGGRLLATWKDGRAHLPAYLDDYAFLLAALVEAMQAGFRSRDFQWAIELADALLAHFEDDAEGGFFFTAHDHEKLIHRAKSGHDDATPSGNAVAARALIELGHLAGNARYLVAAERALELFAPQMTRHPAGFASMLVALDQHLVPPTIVLLRGDPALTERWSRDLASELVPDRLVLDLSVDDLPQPLERPGVGAGTVAWICAGTRCLPPESDWARIRAVLADQNRERRASTAPSDVAL